MTEIKQTIEKKAKAAKKASAKLANMSTVIKNEALLNMAAALVKKKEEILKANAIDVEAAKTKGVKTSYIDRLTLNDKRIARSNRHRRSVCQASEWLGDSSSSCAFRSYRYHLRGKT